MVTNDQTIIKVKHNVLYEVAKAAFEGTLEEEKNKIPYRMIPGPKARYRCCIYKEREVIRERINLAEGGHTGPEDNGLVVQVIEPACEGCPISSYVVTDNCQNCMGKACINACNFGAITPGRYRSHIDAQKCKECGKCAQACPYNAIAQLKRPCKFSCPVNAVAYDENGISQIDEEKCIRCGKCIHSCPFGAIGSKTSIVQVIDAIKSGKKVIAMYAPATEGQFGENITANSWKVALEKLGFAGFIEAAAGADMTAASEAEEWVEAYKEGKQKVTSCCPAFVNMVRRHFPDMADMISTTISPMCATSRMLKAIDPDVVTVFIGPCIAKKSEVADQKIEGNADYVLTYSEIRAIMRAKGVELEADTEAYEVSQKGSVYGKRFAASGGVTAAVVQSIKEMNEDIDVKVCKANGAAECKKFLMMMKAGKLPEHFIEGMVCDGGCVNGPSAFTGEMGSRKDREALLAKADDREIHANLKNFDMDSFSMHRH